MMKFLYQDVPELSGEICDTKFVFSRYEYDEEDVLLSLKINNRNTEELGIYPLAILKRAISQKLPCREVFTKMHRDTLDAIQDASFEELNNILTKIGMDNLRVDTFGSEEVYDDEVLNFNRDFYMLSLETCLIIAKLIEVLKNEEDEEAIIEAVNELDENVSNYIIKRISSALGGSELMIEVDENTTVKLKV